jgi:sulfatase maturation enzyme AslB (radical SAM superfamily)
MLDDLVENLGIDTFVYGGRSVTADGIDVLSNLRRRCPTASIGLIDNGISVLKDRARLFDVRPDWLDISIDGQEMDHDCQRGRDGSYRAGVDGVYWLAENQVAPKVNILACLTTLNVHSIIPMIVDLNRQGFRNFFVTPVTLVDGIRPSPALRLSGHAFADFFAKLRTALNELDDAWVEINLFSVEYAEYLARFIPEVWTEFKTERDSILWHTNEGSGSNDLFVRYCPISLTGTREFIVNTNGDVIAPKSMAAGRVAGEHIAGNLLRQDAVRIVEALPDSNAFEFYIGEFLREREVLLRYM